MGTTKTPGSKISKHHSAYPVFSSANPFDSESETDSSTKPARTSSAPAIRKSNDKTSPYSSSATERPRSPSSASLCSDFAAAKNRYRNDFSNMGELENISLEELEKPAVCKAEETTQKVNGCLRIAEEIREDATKTLVTLHQQGERITQVHLDAANMESDLTRAEKLLGSLGGIFSRTWKPKMFQQIKGPELTGDDPLQRKVSHMEQREILGLSSNSKERLNVGQYSAKPASAMEKVEREKAKQDVALSDLSNLLGQLKEMAIDMGSELERQNKALDNFEDDVDVLNYRVDGAKRQERQLLGK